MPNSKIIIAKIGKTIGLQGELKLHLYGDIQFDQLQHFQPLFLSTPEYQPWLALTPATFTFAKGRIRFHAYAHVTSATAMVHGLLGVDKAQLPPLPTDTFYFYDLLGKTVLNPEGECFGQVTAMINNGAHDVLVCLADQHEYFIPFINEYVVTVAADTIIVLWSKDYL